MTTPPSYMRLPSSASIAGEELYTASIVREFERITSQLSRGDTDDFKPLGRVFEVELHHVPHLKMIIDKPVVTAKIVNAGG